MDDVMSILVGTGWRVDHTHDLVVSSFGEQKMEVMTATLEKVLSKLLSGEHYQKDDAPTLRVDLSSPLVSLLDHALHDKRGGEHHLRDDLADLAVIRGAALLRCYHAEVVTLVDCPKPQRWAIGH